MKTYSPEAPKRSFSILCLATVVLLGPFATIDAQSRASAGASDHLIVSGARVGPVFLGMTEADLYKKLGSPAKTTYGNNGIGSFTIITRR